MRLELVPRPTVSRLMRAFAPAAAFLTAFLIAGLVIWIVGLVVSGGAHTAVPVRVTR